MVNFDGSFLPLSVSIPIPIYQLDMDCSEKWPHQCCSLIFRFFSNNDSINPRDGDSMSRLTNLLEARPSDNYTPGFRVFSLFFFNSVFQDFFLRNVLFFQCVHKWKIRHKCTSSAQVLKCLNCTVLHTAFG